MNKVPMLVLAVLAATALSGCTNSPPATPVGSASGLTITGSPSKVDPNTNALVCWHVDGTGNIAHTALHYDTTSHAGASATFKDYNGTVYPGNQTSQAQAGYNLPGDFCANIPVTSSAVYFRGHTLDANSAPNGKLTAETKIDVNAASASVVAAVSFTGTTPATAAPNTKVQVCWSLTGTGTAKHTAVHTDATSHKTSSNFADYKGATTYPNDRASADPAGYAVPGTYCGNVTTPASGSIYLRAHSMLPPDPPGLLSVEERRIDVTGSNMTDQVVTVDFADTNAAYTVPVGGNKTVCWTVTGTGTVGHVAIHTDNTSHLVVGATFASYNGTTYYPNNTAAANTSGYALSGPTTFCAVVTAPATSGSVLYLRAHAMLPPAAPGTLSPREATITAL